MIIRKPFAFLIKNFRKIHITLLILSLFIAYKIFDVSSFVNEFMRLGTYDLYSDPVTNHISSFMTISTIILIIGSVALLLLLRYKGKPWKTYLIPLIYYIALFFVLNMIKGFFRTYTIDVETTDLRLSRDLLMILIVGQLPAIGIFIMRTFGLDINKFNFNSDQEFLELSEEDREEVEISIDVDVNTFKRLYRRTFRNINYFYQEHKLISKVIISIILLVVLFNMYTVFFVTHKSYNEGDNYNYNGFTIKINKTYATDKDYKGDVISKKSKFIVVSMNIKNNLNELRKFDTSNLHVKAGNRDYSTTETTYNKEFSDFGKTMSKVKSINGGEDLNVIVVYKVDKNIKNNRFVLYFQEKNGNNTLRKMKLNVKDVSKIRTEKKCKLGDLIDININNGDSISFDSYEFSDSIEYTTNKCTSLGCGLINNNISVENGYKILTLEFASDVWESKNMIDFLDMYGKISYKDSSGERDTSDITLAVNQKYLGKIVYLKVPSDLENSDDIDLNFIIRNEKYVYSLN